MHFEPIYGFEINNKLGSRFKMFISNLDMGSRMREREREICTYVANVVKFLSLQIERLDF